jgi:uncharacterized membrane protein (DUF4010 family)
VGSKPRTRDVARALAAGRVFEYPLHTLFAEESPALELSDLFQELAISLGLGLLVGLQRERAASRLGGFRTFPLVTILGTVAALIAQATGAWVIAAALVALAAVILIGNLGAMHRAATESGESTDRSGVTTETAMLVMFCVGAYIPYGRREIAVAIGAGVAVLLHFKKPLHGFVARLGDDDLRAIMQFVLLSLVILPALPDRTYGPYDVLNPHEIWLMVVLIVGLSLGGYVAYKFFGQQAGTVLGGILGGLISSTATTVSYSRRAAENPQGSILAAIVIVIASTVLYARVLVEIAVVAPAHLRATAPPLLILLGTFAVLSAGVWYLNRRLKDELPEHGNPSELKSALVFGAIYAAVLFAVAAAKTHFGERGLYVVAAISGLTDVDAITLSSMNLVNSGVLTPRDGWRIVVIASTSNLVFKAGAVAALGNRRLLAWVGGVYGVVAAVAVVLLLVWPA